MLAGVMESNMFREELVAVPNMDPLGDVLDHLYPLSALKDSKTTELEDPLGMIFFVTQ